MAFQCSDNKNKLRTSVYNFNEKWENMYFINQEMQCQVSH
jgi:hypothetical protein